MTFVEMSSWGAIQPEDVPEARLRLDFGLRPAIMAFNEWAVPGLGGASFVRQLTWSCMGIALAEELGRPAMAAKVAEGVEALASWIALRRTTGYEKDARVQGKRKFSALDRISFDDVSQRGAYVTVPFRRPAAASLAGLGFCVKAEARFSALRLDEPGRELIDHAWGTNGARKALLKWLASPQTQLRNIDQPLREALLPDQHVQAERDLVMRQLCQIPGSERRRNVISLVQGRDAPLSDAFDAAARDTFLQGILVPQHRHQLDGSFALERVRLHALRCAQALVDSFSGDERIKVSVLSNKHDIEYAFDTLGKACVEMKDKLRQLPDAPAEIRLFCQEQAHDVKLVERLRRLALRAPLLFAISGEVMMCNGKNRGRLVDEAEPGEAGWTVEVGDVPRPLLRLDRLLRDLNPEARGAVNGI